MRIAIIGAGMAGLSCADALRDQGHEITLFDKGRGPGGRMSTRRADTPLGPVAFDHGATHFTARGHEFRQKMALWEAQGVVARWPAAGRDAWVGTPGMNAPIRAMAARHHVTWNCVVSGLTNDGHGWWCLNDVQSIGPFDAAVIAIPVEQALPVLSLHDFQMARQAMGVRSTPCWTAMFAFPARVAPLPDIIRHSGPIGWAVRNNAKPGRDGMEAWVVQASADWSQAHLEEDGDHVADLLLAALTERAGGAMPDPVLRMAHRWRYAAPSGSFADSLWNPALGLGACGDWLAHGYVEQAWQSGRSLAMRICGQDEADMILPLNAARQGR